MQNNVIIKRGWTYKVKKNLFIILSFFIIVVVIISYIYYNYIKLSIIAKQNNREYETYTETEILGSSLMTLINKVVNQNEKNEVLKDEKNMYLNNEKDSIRIEVKFLESDKTYSMEAIYNLSSEEFIKNYSKMNFKCTKKEYHQKTNNIKYMLFEQI